MSDPNSSHPAPIPAFLLTREWRDTNQGIELTYWARSDQGPLKLVFQGQRAVCFVERQVACPAQGFRRSEVRLKTLAGTPVDALYFSRQQALQNFLNPAAVPRRRLYETDIRPTERFLMERFITGPVLIEGTGRMVRGVTCFDNPRLRPGSYHPHLQVVSIDIETDFESDCLFSIGLSWPGGGRVFLVTPPNGCDSSQAAFITQVKDETALLKAFLDYLQQLDPDVLIGWNVIGFDLKILEARCKKHGVGFNLGRHGGYAHVIPARGANQMDIARVPGRVVMDGIESLRAAFFNFENFSLEFVAAELLGRGKLIKEQHGLHRGEEIRRQYFEAPLELARYNLEDCRLVEEIFAHTGLIEFALERAALTGLALGRVGGSVAAFDYLYLPRLHRRGFVAGDPPLEQAGGLSSPGGYVLDSIPGLYDDVLVLDFKSLYPSIIRTFLIDPLALWLEDENRVEGFQGASFSRDEPILPGIIEQLWQRRDAAKRDRNAALSQAVKIIMNSFYGVLGTSACRFFDTRLTSSITRRGHEIIQRSREYIEAAGHSVIYGDTDSLFVWLKHNPDEEKARATGARLAQDLNHWWRQNIRDEHKLESCLEIEFETHYLKFLMPTVRGSGAGSKKRYAGMVRAAPGETRLVFKGLETVRTDWTPLAREFQSELFRRVFNGEEILDLVRDIHSRLYAGELDDKLVYRKQLRQNIEQYVRNIPPHVQAARKLEHPGRWIEYVICGSGPEPVIDGEFQSPGLAPDYDHYSERQLKPVADTILGFLHTSFDEIVGGQIELFGL